MEKGKDFLEKHCLKSELNYCFFPFTHQTSIQSKKFFQSWNIFLVFQNLEFAIWCAVGDITAADTYGYYRHTPYFNM
jgi:hypothetical protein